MNEQLFISAADGSWDSATCLTANIARGTVCTPSCIMGYYNAADTTFTCTGDSTWDTENYPQCTSQYISILPSFSMYIKALSAL